MAKKTEFTQIELSTLKGLIRLIRDNVESDDVGLVFEKKLFFSKYEISALNTAYPKLDEMEDVFWK
jgi:hypothetical protein